MSDTSSLKTRPRPKRVSVYTDGAQARWNGPFNHGSPATPRPASWLKAWRGKIRVHSLLPLPPRQPLGVVKPTAACNGQIAKVSWT